MNLPGAIIFINNDLNDISKTKLTNQLYLTETITKSEYDARLANDPYYPVIVHSFKLRVLVTLPTFQDYTNRETADIVMFLKLGLAAIEKNNFRSARFKLCNR